MQSEKYAVKWHSGGGGGVMVHTGLMGWKRLTGRWFRTKEISPEPSSSPSPSRKFYWKWSSRWWRFSMQHNAHRQMVLHQGNLTLWEFDPYFTIFGHLNWVGIGRTLPPQENFKKFCLLEHPNTGGAILVNRGGGAREDGRSWRERVTSFEWSKPLLLYPPPPPPPPLPLHHVSI